MVPGPKHPSLVLELRIQMSAVLGASRLTVASATCCNSKHCASTHSQIYVIFVYPVAYMCVYLCIYKYVV